MPAAKRKPGRGGARPGAGRPVSTGAGTNRVVFRVTFNAAVTGVDIGDFILTTTGGLTGTITNVTPLSAFLSESTWALDSVPPAFVIARSARISACACARSISF